MPRYFFSCEGAQAFTDAEGVELADDRAAQIQAIQNASEILKDNAEAFTGSSRWRSYATDGEGRTVFLIQLDTSADGIAER